MNSNDKSILFITNLASKMNRGKAISETLTDLLENRGWRIFSASGKKNKVFRLLDMIITAYKNRMDYSLAFIEVFSGKSFFWAEIICFLLRKLKKDYILGLFGGNLPEFTRKNPKRVSRLLDSAYMTIAPSNYIIRELSKVINSKISLFPYGVNLDFFQYKTRLNAKPLLITMRGFHSIYQPWIAIEVINILKVKFPEISLIMTGGDKKDGSLEKTVDLINKYKLNGNVRITGFLPEKDLQNSVMASDILLNMPIIDNTPLSLIQAMACGLCVVSTNVGGLPDLLEDQIDGLLVNSDDYISMAAAVERILLEPELASKLSVNARKKSESFDWSVILPKWEKLFESTILKTK